MAEFKIPSHGQICWRELRTRDLEKARSFYSELFGWSLQQTKVTDMPYLEVVNDGTALGGMMAMDENWGEMPSHWASYIAVDDCDAAAQAILQEGGAVHAPPFDAPGVGRMAMVADPSGAGFAIIQFEKPQP
jgi:predicted enzyme related to lactoylglutathione lyase